MENITHVTRQGSKEFTLTNTNKLIRAYEGCTGLKTGSTSQAKFCLSAVAERNGITLISVVMASPDSKTRVKDAAALLNYGFSKCSLYADDNPGRLPEVAVARGVKENVSVVYEGRFQYLSTDGTTVTDVKKKLTLPKEVKAPVKKGSQAGELTYTMNGKELGKIRILYGESVRKATYLDCLKNVWREAF